MPNSEKKKSLYPLIPYLIKTSLFYPNSQATLLNTCIDFSPGRVRSERFSLKDWSERRLTPAAAVMKLHLCHKILLFPSGKQTAQQPEEGLWECRQRWVQAAAPLCPEQWHSTFQHSVGPKRDAAAPGRLSAGLCVLPAWGKVPGDDGL